MHAAVRARGYRIFFKLLLSLHGCILAACAVPSRLRHHCQGTRVLARPHIPTPSLRGPARPSKHQRPRSFSVNGTSKLSERETAGSTKDASPFTVGRLFTLTTWLLEQEKREVIDSEVAIVISSIALACKQIASLVNRAGISNLTGLAGAANQSGEDQKKLDVVANDVFANCLRST